MEVISCVGRACAPPPPRRSFPSPECKHVFVAENILLGQGWIWWFRGKVGWSFRGDDFFVVGWGMKCDVDRGENNAIIRD